MCLHSLLIHVFCADLMTQALALAKKPHIVVGTPGRVVYHLQNTKGFSLSKIKFLVRNFHIFGILLRDI